MLKKTGIYLLLCLMIVAAGCSGGGSDEAGDKAADGTVFTTYKCIDNPLSVEVPKKYGQVAKWNEPKPGGPLGPELTQNFMYQWKSKAGNELLMISINGLGTSEAMNDAQVAEILMTMATADENIGEPEMMEFNGVQAVRVNRKTEFDGQQYDTRQVYFLWKDNLVTLIATVPVMGPPYEEVVDRFFDTFKLGE